MPTLILLGLPIALNQNEIYAMPYRATNGFTSATALEGNLINSATGMVAIPVVDGAFSTAAPFIRCTTGAVNIRLVA